MLVVSFLKYMAKVHADLLKPEADEQIISSDLKLASWRKALTSEKMKGRPKPGNILSRPVLRASEDESVELQQTYEIDQSALIYVRAAWNYRQATTVSHALHSSLVEMTINFWQSGGTSRKLLGHKN